ncbi:hypothetical protein H0H81_011369, partial [Sphagnurus paluster]
MGKRDWKKAVAEDSSKVPYTRSQRKKQQNQQTAAPLPETDHACSDQNTEEVHSNPDLEETALARMSRTGGKELRSFLLSKAVPTQSELPKVYRDIARMPKALQK